MSVVWSVMSYGLPLWFCLNGKGAKLLMAKLQLVQNKAAPWIMGAFHTMPTTHVEYLVGLPTVIEHANVILHSTMLRVIKVPRTHPLHELAAAPPVIPFANHRQIAKRLRSENIWLIKSAMDLIIPFHLMDPRCCMGSCTIDLYPNQFSIITPSAPPKSSKIFKQWLVGWLTHYRHLCEVAIPFASDGSIVSPSLAAAAFSGLLPGATEFYNEHFLLSAHSSYDAEIHAASLAVQFITTNMAG